MARGTVCIIEPDDDDRKTLTSHLSALDVTKRRYRKPTALLSELDNDQPACVITGIHLSEMTGLELQNVLLRDHPEVAVVFTTNETCPATAVNAMKQGAVDYLQKPVSKASLLDAVNKALAVAEVWHRLQAQRKDVHERARHLVDREWELLPLLATGWSNKEIADRIKISIRTVEHYRRTVLKKMGVSSALKLLRPWMLMRTRSPRCLELVRQEVETSRPLPRCPEPDCTAVGSVLQWPAATPCPVDEALPSP